MSSRWDEPPPHSTSPFDLVGTHTAEAVWSPETPPEDVVVELIGVALRVKGNLPMRTTLRLSDQVNVMEGFFRLHDVTLLDRAGRPTRVSLPDLRVRLDDIVIVTQQKDEAPPAAHEHGFISKKARRVVVMTVAHIVYGSVWIHEQASLSNFLDSPDPRFMPITDVRIRWLSDRRMAGRYPIALVQRSHIIGVSSETKGHGHDEHHEQTPLPGDQSPYFGGSIG